MTNNGNASTAKPGNEELVIVQNLQEGTTTSNQAIENLTNLAKARRADAQKLEDVCYYTACAILQVAGQAGRSNHEKLLELVHKLRATTVIDDETKQPLRQEDKVVWKDLPTFGYTFADKLSSIPAPNPSPEKTKEWESTISFFAKLDAGSSDSELDFTNSWAKPYIKAAFGDEAQQEVDEIKVRLAAIWYADDGEKVWGKVGTEGGITVEEWQTWKTGLEAAKERFEGETGKLVVQAWEKVSAAEKK